MDDLQILARQLVQFAMQRGQGHASSASSATLETWLAAWDDRESDAVNRRNFEHWLRRSAVEDARDCPQLDG